jgi:superfamily II DNA or RNA helicase
LRALPDPHNPNANRFVEYGLPGDEIGYVWADHPNYDPTLKIQIASADTLIRRVFLTISIC